ncbi:MAG: hypothetical protein K9L56_14160 [Clostridiales bacterium]|nr:hypothetical protein [Clostridiales bacterium]
MSKDEYEKIPVKEVTEDGRVIINLGADRANADWLQAVRLLENGEENEYKKMSNKPMYREKKEGE